MADRIQFRRDTIANWTKANPVLMEGEIGYVLDNDSQYKMGNGIDHWNDLPLRGFDGTIVHDLGYNESSAMSQKGVTTAIDNLKKDGYVYQGIATPTTNPGTPDRYSFYIASEAGTYTNFGGLSVDDGEVVVLKYNGSTWLKDTTGVGTRKSINNKNQLVCGGKISIIIDYSKKTISNTQGYITYGNHSNPLLEEATNDISASNIDSGLQYIVYNKENNKLDVKTFSDSFAEDDFIIGMFSGASKDNYFTNITYSDNLGNTYRATLDIQNYIDEKDKDIVNSINSILAKVKIGFGIGGVLSINKENKTFSTSYAYYTDGSIKYINAVKETDKAIIPRADGGSYNGYWSALFNMKDGTTNIYFFNSLPSDLTDYYLIAIGGSMSNDEFVIFSTSKITPSVNGIQEKYDAQINSIGDSIGEILLSKNQLVYGDTGLTLEINYENMTIKNTYGYVLYGNKYYDLLQESTNEISASSINSGLQYIVYNRSNKKFDVKSFSDGFAADDFIVGMFSGSSKNNYFTNITYTDSLGKAYYSTKSLNEEFEKFKNQTSFQPASQKGIKFMSLGDSISTESYFIPVLRNLLNVGKTENVDYVKLSVVGATWADRSNTTEYNGNPQQGSGGDPSNCLGNQVQKLRNGLETTYKDFVPDIILIFAGTNDLAINSLPSDDTDETIESYFCDNDGYISCTEPTFDASDTYMEKRKNIIGGMRYTCEKLQEIYPKATIYICTPIQTAWEGKKYARIKMTQSIIKKVSARMGLKVIPMGEECGICGDYEYQGSRWNPEWATESQPKNGRDLIDGLHPNQNSGKYKMANCAFSHIQYSYVDNSKITPNS